MRRSFFIKHDGRFIKINLQDIVYVQACQNYLKLVLTDQAYMIHLTLKKLEQELPSCFFIRIHRSYIVTLDKIMAFRSDQVYLPDNTVLPIGEKYKAGFRNRFWVIDREREAVLC